MRIHQPSQLLAGFHLSDPVEKLPQLAHLGEQWWPGRGNIGEHEHEVWEFYLQLQGHSHWQVDSQSFHIGPNACLAVPPHTPHGMVEDFTEPVHFLFAAIDPSDFLARHTECQDCWDLDNVQVATDVAESMIAPFRQLLHEARVEQNFQAAGIRSAIDSLLIAWSRLQRPGPSTMLTTAHPAAEEARQLIDRHPERAWNLADLGRLVGLSPNHLAQLFSRSFGLPPHRYLLQQRIEEAKRQLRETDRPVTAIAIDLGFSSSQHFARCFKDFAGCTASAFRKHEAGVQPV